MSVVRQSTWHVNHALTNLQFPSEFGRTVEGLNSEMTAMELKQINLFAFPVIISRVQPLGRERPHIRGTLVGALAFIARAASLPSYEFNFLNKAKVRYALKKWRESYKELIGQAYIGVNEVMALSFWLYSFSCHFGKSCLVWRAVLSISAWACSTSLSTSLRPGRSWAAP